MAGATDDGGPESPPEPEQREKPSILRNNPVFLRIGIAELIILALAGLILARWGDTAIGNVMFAILVSVAVIVLVPTILVVVSLVISDRKFR